MVTNRLGRAQRVILLCALALCVAAMHHISTAKDTPGVAMAQAMPTAEVVVVTAMNTGSGEHHPGMPDGVHNLLHLCLAVVGAAVALFLALLLLSRKPFPANVAAPARPRGSRPLGRPPDRRGREILTSLCVLRA